MPVLKLNGAPLLAPSGAPALDSTCCCYYSGSGGDLGNCLDFTASSPSQSTFTSPCYFISFSFQVLGGAEPIEMLASSGPTQTFASFFGTQCSVNTYMGNIIPPGEYDYMFTFQDAAGCVLDANFLMMVTP